MSFSKLRELVMDREASVLESMGSQRVGHDWATELNWGMQNRDQGYHHQIVKRKVKAGSRKFRGFQIILAGKNLSAFQENERFRSDFLHLSLYIL